MAKKKEELKVKEEKIVTPKVDLEKIKSELTSYVNDEIKKGFNEEVKRINNKIVREKNKKIVFRNIVILILLVVIGFLVYLLNSVDYFDKFFVNSEEKIVEKGENSEQNEIVDEEDEAPSLEELKSEFSYLLRNIKIDETSIYVNDYYSGNLTDELKNYLSLNLLEFNNLEVEDDCNIVEKDIFKEAYTKIFDGEFSGIGFDYNGNKVRYLNKLDSFVSSSILQKLDSNIQREIIDIKISDQIIKITTVEGVIINDRLYNILTKKEINKYKKDSIINYQDKLNTITYTFKNNLLENISK